MIHGNSRIDGSIFHVKADLNREHIMSHKWSIAHEPLFNGHWSVHRTASKCESVHSAILVNGEVFTSAIEHAAQVERSMRFLTHKVFTNNYRWWRIYEAVFYSMKHLQQRWRKSREFMVVKRSKSVFKDINFRGEIMDEWDGFVRIIPDS